MPKTRSIKITRATQNNLKNISLEIPHYQLIGIVGVSGSGKSSLAFDVIGNEGRRQYLDTIPSFARQFMGYANQADVEHVDGLFPVIAVEQFKRSGGHSSTVGTLTELYDLFRSIYSRFGSEEGLSRSHFSFNSQLGYCPHCKGLGLEERISVDKLVSDPNKTLREGAMVPTLPNGYIMYSQVTVDVLNTVCEAHGFNVDIPWNQLSEEQQDVVLNGSEKLKVPFGKHSIESRLKWTGLKAKPREEGYYKGMLPIMKDILKRDRNKNILRFVESIPCTSCNGKRLNQQALASNWNGKNIDSLVSMRLDELLAWLKSLKTSLKNAEEKIVTTLIERFELLTVLGLGHLQLKEQADALSPTQVQRIRVANQLNTDLSNVLYVFDEPSMGMNAEQKSALLQLFNTLVNKGNTVILVEHDLDMIRSTDWVVEIGPKSGSQGGELTYNGPTDAFLQQEDTPTQLALSNPLPDLTIDFTVQPPPFAIQGENMYVSQSPIGRTPRSNPATYTGIADHIRDHMAQQELAKERGYKKGRFSFNNKGGRCETCEGAGKIQVGMHYMGKVELPCESCGGQRFNAETLEVKSNGKNIAEIYELSVSEAQVHFHDQPKMLKILDRLSMLGLGYLQLGQSSTTLSGGEAQRVKLATHLSKSGKKTFVLEEPTNALHHNDILQLIKTLNQLVQEGNEIICITTHPLLLRQQSAVSQPKTSISALTKSIDIHGATTNNLKNVNASFLKDQITVVTGVSGSGKSSLVFDTLFAEAQSRFAASTSVYIKTFLKQANPAKAESFEVLTPTVAINRKNLPLSPRSTVGTLTGINEKLRFLFSRHSDIPAKNLSFNSKHGMCLTCSGIGLRPQAQRRLLAPDWNLSVAEGAFTHNSAIRYYGNPDGQFVALLKEATSSTLLHKPLNELSNADLELLFYGTGDKEWETTWYFKNKSREGQQAIKGTWKGFAGYINEEYAKVQTNKKIDTIKALLGDKPCETCNGQRLNEAALSIKIDDKNLHDIGALTVHELSNWFQTSAFDIPEVADLIYQQVQPIIESLTDLGLGHLSLNRRSLTLSGGEGQRLRLAQFINCGLTGMTYVLDEPTIGLHNDNVKDLWKVIQRLKDKGNTVVIVEHHPFIIRHADHRIEMGPGAGTLGGEIVSPSPLETLPSLSFTAPDDKGSMVFEGVNIFSLHHRHFEFKMGQFNVVTGLSGSGKSTLMNKVVVPSILEKRPVHCDSYSTADEFDRVIHVNQRAMTSAPSSTIASVTGLLDELAKIYAALPEAKAMSLKKSHFLYSHKDGKCPMCNGMGKIKIALDVVDDVWNDCDVCHGSRYNNGIKPILLHDISIDNLLKMCLLEFFEFTNQHLTPKQQSAISPTLQLLLDFGMGHIKLNQATNSLSGGETQRLKLVLQLRDIGEAKSLIVLDEPSTGLNAKDVQKLIEVLFKYRQMGHTLVCIEHDEALIAAADWEVVV